MTLTTGATDLEVVLFLQQGALRVLGCALAPHVAQRAQVLSDRVAKQQVDGRLLVGVLHLVDVVPAHAQISKCKIHPLTTLHE